MDEATGSKPERDHLQMVIHQARHVFVDYFKPPGARRLLSTLSSLSQAKAREFIDYSKEMLTVGEHFDFERLVKRHLHKHVRLLVFLHCTLIFLQAIQIRRQTPAAGCYVQEPTRRWAWCLRELSTDTWLTVQSHERRAHCPDVAASSPPGHSLRI